MQAVALEAASVLDLDFDLFNGTRKPISESNA
jgi:hypothetical protein